MRELSFTVCGAPKKYQSIHKGSTNSLPISSSYIPWPRCNFCLWKCQQYEERGGRLPFPPAVLISQPSASRDAEAGQTVSIRDALGPPFLVVAAGRDDPSGRARWQRMLPALLVKASRRSASPGSAAVLKSAPE